MVVLPTIPKGEVELVVDAEHARRVVSEGMLRATASLDIATADFKAMLVPNPSGLASRGRGRRRDDAPSIVEHFVRLAERGVEIRILHAGVPSSAALVELKKKVCATTKRARSVADRITIRRCPRLHAKAVIVDAASMYLGSANLTGAGLGAKGAQRRNFEWGVWTESGPLIDAVMQQFNMLWEAERCTACDRKDVCPVPLEEPEL